LPLFRQCR